jgi:hypothetical protein
MYATWTDATESNTRSGWSYDGATWTNVGGNEDRMNFAWSIGGAGIVCGHDPSGDATVLFDVWHWKATRTGPANWADDKYWDGTGRHADAKTAGGYSDNSVVAQAADGAAITAALGNSSSVAVFSNDDRPFWNATGAEISWSAGVNATPLTNFISGYNTTLPTGSRGDVHTGSRYDGSAWHVEYSRALDTGNNDDIAFSVGTTNTFYLSLHDNAGDSAHLKYGGFSPTAIQLALVSGTTPTPTPTGTPSLFDNTFVLIGIVLAILVVAILFARTLGRST